GEEVTNLGLGRLGLGIFQLNLAARLFDHVDDFKQAPHTGFAGARIDLDLDLGFSAIATLGGLFHGVLHRFDHDHAVDALFASNSIGDLQQLKAIRANGHYFVSSARLSSSL